MSAALALLLATPALLEAAPLTADLWFESTISTSAGQPLLLRAEINYDDALSNAPIAVIMPGFSPTLGNLGNVRAQAQRLRSSGFFAISVAMRGRDGSEGVRDSGGLEIHDIYDAVESAKDTFPARLDPTNVHITGYSGGGGNVMSALVRFPDLFRLGSSFFGMSDYGFDPIDGWYNNGAAFRTTILDHDVGNPNTGGPGVLDRYHARASNLAAANSRHAEVHLFVNDNEAISPPVNHQSFAQIGGSHVWSHIGTSAMPSYEDFNGNGMADPGELQLWPHGFPTANEQAAAEQWYLDRLLSGQIPEPQLDAAGTLAVAGFLVTRSFEVWLGDGQNAAGELDYSLGESLAWFELEVLSSDTEVTATVSVVTDFMTPTGAAVEARIEGALVDSFPAGEEHVFTGLTDGDQLVLSIGSSVAALPGSPWIVGLAASGFGLAATAIAARLQHFGPGSGRERRRASTR